MKALETINGHCEKTQYVCNKLFPQKGHVNEHIRRVHEKQKDHQCLKCEKSFFPKA